MKKLLAMLLAVLMVLSLAACAPAAGNNETTAAAGDETTAAAGDETTAADAADLKVGAIYINSKNDTAGYTFAHHNGITTAMKELGLDPETQLFIVDEVPEDKQAVLDAVDTLVGEGAEIIFGISFGYIDALEEAAAEYPEVIFSHATGYKANETNFNNYFGRIYQARYLAGIAAGLKSLETGNNNVGYVAAYGTEYAETASLLSGTFAPCLASGRDISQGGAKYNNTGCMGGGLSNVADSLMVIKKLVYEEKRISLEELKAVLENDWQKDPALQQYVKHRIPKWGNNNPEVDSIARSVADFYTTLVNGTPNNRGGMFVASMFTLDFNLIQGERTGALPDGRNARTYLAKGIGAMTAMDKQGVTAHIESVTRLDFRRIPNGSVLDIFLHPSAVKGEQGLKALISLIKTYFAKGGYGIQFNVLDHNALIDAQKHPEKYATLQVRVCGWNVYFVTLSPREQEQFIHTTMQELG